MMLMAFCEGMPLKAGHRDADDNGRGRTRKKNVTENRQTAVEMDHMFGRPYMLGFWDDAK